MKYLKGAALTPILAAMMVGLLPSPSTARTPMLLGVASGDDNHNLDKKISNAFQDTDLKQALSDISLATGVPIVPDETVQGNVTASFKERNVEQALSILLLPGGYSWVKVGDSYLVGKAEPTSPNFLRFAETKVYKPNFQIADKLVALLPPSMAGYVKAAAGDRTITITAASFMMDRIMHDIKLLDAPVKRILLEAVITEANTSVLKQYDLSFVWKNFGLSDNVAGPTSSIQYSKITQSDAATLSALVGKGLATIKASPRIMTVEGKEASVEVGQQSYFEVLSGPVSYPVTTIQEIKTGISLKMTPFVSDDGQITVVLDPEVSDATGSGSNGLPINTIRRASTTVRVKDGETIIIGGMTFESKKRNDTKIPVLGDLPFLGSMFRFHSDQMVHQDVIIMITPKVISD